MENIFERLQFVRGLNPNREDGVFSTREDAINYVLEKQLADRPTIVGEPIVLRYESGSASKGPNVILAIGSLGNGTPTQANRTFFIDTQKTEDEVLELNDRLENAIKSLNILPLESDTIKLNSEKIDDGTIISGDVKIADYRIVSGRVNENIIQTEDNKGLYAFVDMDYDPNTFVITFNVNGVTKGFQLPVDQHVVKGWYSPEEESIFIKLADGSQIKVLVTKLIEEWTVLPDGQTINDYDVSGHSVNYTPIVLTKTHVGSKETEHEGIYEWQDVLEADIRVADHISDNIIHKDRTGRYLYVKGTADNIMYRDGQTVKDAIDNIDCKISTSTGNLIYKRPDGIFATAMLGYKAAENKITYTYSDGNSGEIKEIEFQLNSVKILEDITYDPVKEEIVIRYIDAQGEYQKVEIPVADIIEEWDVDNEAHNINLTKYRSSGQGKDILTADAKIHRGDNNILEDLNHELYVNGISDNIKYDVTGVTTVKQVIDNISAETTSINDKLDREINNREAAIERIDKTIGSGFTEDVHENITYKFSELESKIDNEIERSTSKDEVLETSLNEEKSRSLEKDSEHDTKISNIETTIGSGFSTDTHETVTYKFEQLTENVNNIENSLQAEIERSAEKDSEQDGRLDTIDAEIATISADSLTKLTNVLNEDHSINVKTINDENGKPTIKVIDVNLSEEVEQGKQNIIKLNADGLYAGVDLVYEEAANKLIFSTTNGVKEIQLESMSSIVSIEYNPTKEAIVITYITNGHEIKVVEIPLGELINEWRVWEGHEGAVQLSKIRIPSGTSEQDILKASVVISEVHDDNILINDNGALYVSGEQIEENKQSISAINDNINSINDSLSTLETAISNEILRATSSEQNIDTKVEGEITRAKNRENDIIDSLNDEILRATSREDDITNSLNDEVLRSTNKDAELTNSINNEVVRAMSAETSLNTKIDNEILRSTNKDTELKNQIDNVESDLNIESSRALNAESALSNNIIAETERARTSEAELNALISGEIVRATNRETYIEHLIDDEIENRISGDSINSDAILSEKERAIEAETRLETSINNESLRAQTKEDELESSIENEVIRAQNADNELYQRISDEITARSNGDTTLSASISNEISRATFSEETISQNLSNEISRSITEDNRLNNLISGETAARQERDEELENAIRNITLTFDDTTSIDFTKTTGNVVTADVKLQEGDNIIKLGQGIYASVHLSYDSGTNKIKLVTSNGEDEEIQLVGASLLEDLHYDPVNKALVITYKDATGEEHTVQFGVSELFNEWSVNNPSEKSAVELTKTYSTEPGGEDKISARVLITDDRDGDGKPDAGSDNLIEIRNNGLYVNGSALSAATATTECVESELKAVERAIFGNQSIGECGDGFEYEAPGGSIYINNATTINNATYILDQAINRLSSYTENVENKVDIVSGNTDCAKNELKVVENNILGMPLLNACGEGDAYRPNEGTNYISAGTSFNNTDVILDREIKKANDSIDILNQKIIVSSGDVECVNEKTEKVYELLYGQGSIIPGCGEGISYQAYAGSCVISGATSFSEADKMLSDQVCQLLSAWDSGETCTTLCEWEEEGDSRKLEVDVKLSHGRNASMTDDDLVTINMDGSYIEPSVTEFTDTNALRIVCLQEGASGITPSVSSKQNGIYLSNVWDCGLYYSPSDTEAKTKAEEAGYNTNYSTDESSSASNLNYMNNVRQHDI